MSNPIRKLVKEIQYKADLTLDEIAVRLGYSPAYFRNEVSKGTSKSVLDTLQTKFKDVIEQNVVIEKAHAKDTSDAHIVGIGDRYLNLLEETLREKKEAEKGLEMRLGVIEGNQKEILRKLERLVEGIPEPLTSKAGKFEQEVIVSYKDKSLKKDKKSRPKP